MRLNFRQGIISHQTTSGVQDFLGINNGNVDLKANNRPTSITIAHSNSNYTHIEDFTVVNAWVGPFNTGTDYWLYWDFNPLTFERTFGYTTLKPVAQSIEPGNGNVSIINVQPGSAPGVGRFTVSGYFQFASTYNFAVINSDNNDGNYTVVESIYNDLLNETVISVNENVSTPIGTEYGSATFDIDFYGEPLLQQGRHWYDISTNRHYVWIGNAWTEVLRVFAAQILSSGGFSPLSINLGGYIGTQIGDTSSVLSGRVIFDEYANAIIRDDRTFFTTEDQFFANSSSVDAIRLESNVARAQLTGSSVAAYSVVAWIDDGKISIAEYNDIGKKVIGILTEDLLINEVGAVVIQGVITNPNWNWTSEPSAFPVGNPLWIENGELVPYNPHTYKNRNSAGIIDIDIENDNNFFQVIGAYTLSENTIVNIVNNTNNNDGSYLVANTELITTDTLISTIITVKEPITDPMPIEPIGEMLLNVSNFPYGQVPVARILSNNTVIFEQGLGGVGDRGLTGSIDNLPPATLSSIGGVYLSVDAIVEEFPIVVGDNDPRLSVPIPHTHVASTIGFTPSGSISSSNVQDAIEEIDLAGTPIALDIAFTPSGSISSSNVQDAIEEISVEYALTSHSHTSADTAVTPYTGTNWGTPTDSNITSISSTDVQASIEELMDEKAPKQPTFATETDLPIASNVTGMIVYVNDVSRLFFSTGTSWVQVPESGASQIIPYDLAFFISGVLQQDKLVGSFVATRTVDIAATAPNSLALAGTPAIDATYTIDIIHKPSPSYTPTVVGQVAFQVGVTSGVITFANPLTINAGDLLQIQTDDTATPDSELKDISVTIVGCATTTGC